MLITPYHIGKTKLFFHYWHVERLAELSAKIDKKLLRCQKVIRGFLVRRQMKHQWEIVESQRKYIASFLSDIQLKGETLMQFQQALNDHDEARNVEQMFLDVAESEESRMSAIPNVPPPPPLTNGIHKSESAADSAYGTSQPPSPGKISTSTEDDVFHENGASFIPPPPLPVANGNAGRKSEEDELADCGYVSMKDAPPALKNSLKLDNNENEMRMAKKEGKVKTVAPSEDDVLPPPPPVDQQEIQSCPSQEVEFPPPPPMAEIAGDTKENIAAIRARFKQQEDTPKEEPPRRGTSPPRKKIISLAPVIADGAKSDSRPEVTSPSKSRIAERIAQLKEQEVVSERDSGPAGATLVRESEYANVPGNDHTVKRRPPAPVRDPNTRLTMIENTSVQRMSYGNGVDVRMVRTRSEEYRIESQYGGLVYDDTVNAYYGNVPFRNSLEHTYGEIADVPPPPVQAPPPPPPMSHKGPVMGVAPVPPPPAHAPPPVPPPMPSGNTNNTNNIFMQIPGATARPRSEILFPEDVPPPPCVAPPPPPQPPPVPSGPKPAHLSSSPVMSSYAQPPPPAMTGFTPPPPPPPVMGGVRPQHIPAPPPMGGMVPPPPQAPNGLPPPPPPSANKPVGGGLLDGLSAVQLKSVSKDKTLKKAASTEAPMDNLMAELQNFSGRLRPTPKQSKPPSPEIKEETDSGVSPFQLKPTKTNGTRSNTPSPPLPPSPPQHQNGNNSTQSNAYRLSPNTTTSGAPPTTPKSPKPTPMVMPKPGKVPGAIPASPTTAPPAPPMAPPAPQMASPVPQMASPVPQKAFTPPSPQKKAPVAPPPKASSPQMSPKRPDYSKRVSMPPDTRPLSPTSMAATSERTRKVSAPSLPVQLPEGYENMPAWKKAMVEKKLKEAQAKEEEEKRKQEEELAKWQGVPEWKRKLMMEKEKKKVEDAEANIDKSQLDREVKLRSMPTWKRNIVKKKLGSDSEDSSPAKGASGFEETSTAL